VGGVFYRCDNWQFIQKEGDLVIAKPVSWQRGMLGFAPDIYLVK